MIHQLTDGGLEDGIGPAEAVIVREVPDDEPDQPDELAQYVVDAVDRQDSDALRALAHYALERASWMDRDLEPDELQEEQIADDAEEIVDVQESGSGSGVIVEKKIPCGKSSCSTCPHGPYKYRNYRENGEHKTEYLGPVGGE